MKTIPVGLDRSAKVDDSDFERVSRHKWALHVSGSGRIFYAKTNIKQGSRWRQVQLGRFIMGISGERLVVEHINGDGLDCRRANLRIVERKPRVRALMKMRDADHAADPRPGKRR